MDTIRPTGLRATVTALTNGSVALLILGLQPIVLGALSDEGRLTLGQIGGAATAELLAIGVTTGLLAAGRRPAHLRATNAFVAAALAAVDGASCYAHGVGLVGLRGCAGVSEGVLLWIAVSIITRAPRPDRLSGVFLGAQTLAQAVAAGLLPLTLMARSGANGAFVLLAILSAAAVFGSPFLPDGLPALPKPSTGGGVPLPGVVGLTSVFLYWAGLVGLWVFLDQLGAHAHVSAASVGFAVSAALAAQIAGTAIATVTTGRLPTLPILVACGTAALACTWIVGSASSAAPYFAAVLAFGFLWMFAAPYQIKLVLDLDSSRRTALLIPAAQLIGSAAGPLVTSALASGSGLAAVVRGDIALFGLATVLVIVLLARKPQPLGRSVP